MIEIVGSYEVHKELDAKIVVKESRA